MLTTQFLLLGAVLFCIGVYGVLARKNAVMVLMSIDGSSAHALAVDVSTSAVATDPTTAPRRIIRFTCASLYERVSGKPGTGAIAHAWIHGTVRKCCYRVGATV